MELLKVLPGDPYGSLVDEVNIESFPEEERMDTDMQLSLCAAGRLEVWAVVDEGRFVGFTTVFPSSELSYVFFLAIHKDARSHGYGAKVLELLRLQYAGRRVVLDIEPVDPSVPGNEMRVRRRGFYLRNGFHSSGYLLTYCGMSFEIMYSGDDPFDIADYRRMMHEIYLMVCESGYEGFEPVIVPMA